MANSTIMFIRHAEKPDKQQKGVTLDGEHDEHSLSVHGWTRAGALAALFGSGHAVVTTPGRIIATAPNHSYKSKREHDTALPTAKRLGIVIEATPIPANYEHLAADIQQGDCPTLIVWHHGSIPDFVRAFPISNPSDVPIAWPEERFDVIWALEPEGDTFRWQAIPQHLLEGDTST